MPYSDDLYSSWDDGESVGEQIGDGLNQPRTETTNTQAQLPQHGIEHAAYLDQGAATSTINVDLYGSDDDHVFSPTDGYFGGSQGPSSTSYPVVSSSSNVPYVPNVWVRDPSLPQESTAESKAREARQERGQQHTPDETSLYSRNGPSLATRDSHLVSPQNRDTHPASSSTYTPYALTTASYTSFTPQRAAYDQGQYIPSEAPPAYTPSPTSPPTSPQSSDSSPRNYSTFSSVAQPAAPMGREETQGLLANEPQSMGNPEDSFDNIRSWRDRLSGRLRHRGWRHVRTILVGLLLLFLTVGFLTAGITSARTERDHRSRFSKGRRPNMPSNDDFHWDTGNCKDNHIVRDTQKFDLSFAPDKQLSIVQRVSKNDRYDRGIVSVSGTIYFQRVGSGTPGPSAVVKVIVNDDRIDVAVDWDGDKQALDITVPHAIIWDETSTRPCVNIDVIVSVPEDGKLSSLKVGAVQLNIMLLDNLSIEISDRAVFETVVGYIVAAANGDASHDKSLFDTGAPDSFRLRSRYIEVETVSASIEGSWPLYDYLSFESISGNIRVGIEPKEADKDAPKPAILSIQTLSGDVDFHVPVHSAQKAFALSRVLPETEVRAETVLPPRDYRVSIHTTSGHIKGSAAFSSTCTVKTTSGSVAVELLPVLDSSLAEEGSKAVTLTTHSTSGTKDITVLDPLWINAAQRKYVDLPALPPASPALPPRPGNPPYVPVGDDDPYKWMRGPQLHERGLQTVAARALRNLNAHHSATSANMRLHYPTVWEGEIRLTTSSGKLEAQGEGVKIIENGGHWGQKKLVAKKGEDGGGSIIADAMSGNIAVLVGGEL